MNVGGCAGALLALFAVTTPPGQFGSQFAPTATVVMVVAAGVLLRGHSLGVEVAPGRLVVHRFWWRTELASGLHSTVRVDRVGKSRFVVRDGTRTVTLPLVVKIGKPRYPRLKVYPRNTLEVRRAGQWRWHPTVVDWGTQAMVDTLGVEYPVVLSGPKPSGPALSTRAAVTLSAMSTASMSFLVAYSATEKWPLLVVSVLLMTGVAIVMARGRRA